MTGKLGFSLREQLALARTSMSQVQIASIVGVSPRTIGRWLRESSPGGVREIPQTARDTIGVAFDLHTSIARQAARESGIPFLRHAPVLAKRKARDDGTLGDRVFIENAQFFGPDLLQLVMLEFAFSGRYVVATVGSRIDLHQYHESAVDSVIKEKESKSGRKLNTQAKRAIRRNMAQSLAEKFGVTPKELVIQPELRDVYTKQRFVSDQFDQAKEISEILRQVNNRHAPAANGPGTSIAHTIIVQLKRERGA